MLDSLGVPAVLSLALVALAPAAAQDPALADAIDAGRAAGLCREADRALQRGRTEEGRHLFLEALEAASEYPDAHIGLGRMAMAEQRHEDALREFVLARDGYAKMGDAVYHARLQRFQQSRDEINRLQDTLNQLRSGPGFAQPSGGGATSLDLQKIENRIAQLEGMQPPRKETAAEPPAEVFFLIGNAQFRLGRLDDAVASYETCVEKDPTHLGAYTNTALAHWKAGRPEAARATLDRAEARGLRVDPRLKADLGAK